MATAVSILNQATSSAPVRLERRPSPNRRGIRLVALPAPLLGKPLCANALVVAAVSALSISGWIHSAVALVGAAALLILIHLGLVVIALRPVRDLEITAVRDRKSTRLNS